MRKIGLGGVYNAMRRKFYFDELYKATVVRFALWFSQATAWFDRTIIDGVVNAVGRFGRWVADVSARFDKSVIDGIVNGVGSLANEGRRCVAPGSNRPGANLSVGCSPDSAVAARALRRPSHRHRHCRVTVL